MREIALTQNKFTIVDDEDYDYLSQWNWYYNRGYAARAGMTSTGMLVYLHRDLMSPPDGMQVDHINRNSLDNRRSNLRICSQTENRRNQSKYSNNTSGYKGVSWDKAAGKWSVSIRINSKLIKIGRFDDIVDAAKAYDGGAKKYFGEFAVLNFTD